MSKISVITIAIITMIVIAVMIIIALETITTIITTTITVIVITPITHHSSLTPQLTHHAVEDKVNACIHYACSPEMPRVVKQESAESDVTVI